MALLLASLCRRMAAGGGSQAKPRSTLQELAAGALTGHGLPTVPLETFGHSVLSAEELDDQLLPVVPVARIGSGGRRHAKLSSAAGAPPPNFCVWHRLPLSNSSVDTVTVSCPCCCPLLEFCWNFVLEFCATSCAPAGDTRRTPGDLGAW